MKILITDKKKDRLYIGSHKNLIEINLKQNPESKVIKEKEILTELSNSLIELNQLDQAEEYLTKVTEILDPSYPFAYLSSANIYKKKNIKKEINESVKIEIKKMLKKYTHKDVVEFVSKKENLPKKMIYNYCLKLKK